MKEVLIILLCLQSFRAQQQTITVIYSQWCYTSLVVKRQVHDIVVKSFEKIVLYEVDISEKLSNDQISHLQRIKNSPKLGDELFNGTPEILFFRDGKTLEYKFDIKELKYFMSLFFEDKLPEQNNLKSPIIKTIMKHSPDVILFYGNPVKFQKSLSYFIQNALENILYTYYLINPILYNEFHKEMFVIIQNYSLDKLYIVLRRKEDRFDMIKTIEDDNDQFEAQFCEFVKQYGRPQSLKQLSLRAIEYSKSQEKTIIFHLITADLFMFQKYIELFDTTVLNFYRQRRKNQIFSYNPLFIRSDVTGQTKALLYRHLQKSLVDTPLLVCYTFQNGFKYKIYEQKGDQLRYLHNQKQWIENLIYGGISQPQYPSPLPFSLLNQQQQSNVTEKNIIHDQLILRDIFLKQKQHKIQLNILFIVVSKNCKPCMKLYAILSQNGIDQKITIVMAQNYIIIPEIDSLIGDKLNLVPQLFYIWGKDRLQYKQIQWDSFQFSDIQEQLFQNREDL